jgi:hypothetical protein
MKTKKLSKQAQHVHRTSRPALVQERLDASVASPLTDADFGRLQIEKLNFYQKVLHLDQPLAKHRATQVVQMCRDALRQI